MADNVTIDEGTGVPVGADEIDGVKYQRIKIIVGANNTNDGDVASGNPLPVTGSVTADLGANNDVTVTGTVDLGATDNAVLDTIAAKDFATQTTLAAMNAKLVTGTVIGDVNLGATDNAVLDAIAASVAGQQTDALTDSELRAMPVPVSDGGGALTVDGTVTAELAAGSNNIGDVDVASIASGQTITPVPLDTGGLTMFSAISAATTNDTNVKNAAGQIFSIQAFNKAATIAYVKLYNKATTPTVGTDTPVKRLAIPANTDLAGFILDQPMGLAFADGIGIGITGGIADNDTTAVGANDVLVNIDYK